LDLVGETSPPQAFANVRRASVLLTEDCGLMHMGWVTGVPLGDCRDRADGTSLMAEARAPASELFGVA